ncbi:hypothetical protein PVE_R2G0348 [Pseudomonas veronii 1YdBTEX2]|uniref:Uncharacterized protein n=1 Tax=Pseudomonas veronii 1YdBTEX2 TaxID=1295141 RepID=A0A1D3K7S9_PSEVE|nr:hypothetical protein PVE_R2G0348 [Pseudomonas veronii 1YdBTEX2]
MTSLVLCYFDTCMPSGGPLPAVRDMPQSTDQGGESVSYVPCCELHSSTWWHGSDWNGQDREKAFIELLKLEDFVSSHVHGDVTQEGIQLGQILIAGADDYASAAAEIAARGFTGDLDAITD